MKEVVYNLAGKRVGEVDLKPEVFGVEAKADLIYQTAVAYASNKRKSLAHTKTKGEVSGGGRKPWKQKGTGNARTGSIRNPIFRGGGIIFGPRNTVNFQKKINKKAKKKAFLAVLSSKLKDKELRIVEDFELKNPSTKTMDGMVKGLKLEGKSLLVATEAKNEVLKQSLKNMARTNYRVAGDLCALDLLNAKFLVLDKAAVNYYEKKYGSKS